MLVEAVEDYAIFMLDPGGHIVSWNAGAQRSKLYTAEEIIGQHFRVFYPPELQASRHPEEELALAVRDGHYEEEGWRIRKDGSRFWANVVITAVFNAEGEHVGFTKVTRDTTVRRRLEQERESALRALAQANTELESLNHQLQQAADDQAQFLAVTAHELRTPIGLLAGSADLLSTHHADLTDDERRDLRGSITSGTGRPADSRPAHRLEGGRQRAGPAPRGRHPLRRRDEGRQHRRVGAPGRRRRVRRPAGLVVHTDGDRLAQILENLLLNALRHGDAPVTLSFASDANGP